MLQHQKPDHSGAADTENSGTDIIGDVPRVEHHALLRQQAQRQQRDAGQQNLPEQSGQS